MRCSPSDAADGAGALAGALLGERAVAVHACESGRNNSVWRVRAGGADVALKIYDRADGRGPERLAREFGGLEFLAAHGVARAPRPIARDDARLAAVYEWIDGEAVDAPDAADVDTLADFAAGVAALAGEPGAGALADASDACFSGADVAAQIERRARRLDEVRAEVPGLGAFLDDLAELARDAQRCARAAYAGIGRDFDAPLAAGERVPSVSDLGFHNVLRRGDGNLAVVDFEYFGWDDPAKLVADACLHPGVELPASLARRFERRVVAAIGDASVAILEARLAALRPLFAIAWCLIVLNPYLPSRRAGAPPPSEPLARARARLAAIGSSRARFTADA